MKIELDKNSEFEISELYCGVSIKTDDGVFHVCERDGGLEIRFNNGAWYSWSCNTREQPQPSDENGTT